MGALARSEPYVTAAAFAEMPDAEGFELDDGILRRREVSRESSAVGLLVGVAFALFAKSSRLGRAFGSDLGLQIIAGRPERVPRADAVFVTHDRLAHATHPDHAYLEVPPNVAVEVVSPTNHAGEIDRKVTEYLAAGVDLVWVIYPETRRAHIFRADGTVSIVAEGGVLDGENVMPGFQLPLASLFD
jgi:Uma2 family endonuclease